MGNHHIVCKKYVGYVNAARRCRRYIMRQHHAMRQLTASGELRAATAARVARVASSGINVYGHSYHSGERRNQHLRPQLPQRPERRATESIATSSSERRNKCLRPAASGERRAASGESIRHSPQLRQHQLWIYTLKQHVTVTGYQSTY